MEIASLHSHLNLQGSERLICSLLAAKPIWTEKELRQICTMITGRVDQKAEEIFKARRQLARLRKLPVVVQRSEEWYKLRQGLLTASDLAQSLGKGKFGSRNKLLEKKAYGGSDSSFQPTVPALKWGVMYEPVAAEVYRKMYGGIVLYEFGLIQHPTFPIFGASPDGISALGIMLEIKCPWMRNIVPNEVPEQYYLQIQGQLEVCNLDECDYLECEFKEFSNWEDLQEQVDMKGTQSTYIGCVIECYGQDPYIYSDVHSGTGLSSLQAWVQTKDQELGMEKIMTRHIWILKSFNLVRVKRDRSLFQSVKPQIETFWKDVLDARSKPPPVPKERKSASSKFAFIDEDD